MTNKTPERTCIACGRKSAKGDLIRVVRGPEGAVSLDAAGKAAGRGAYVCLSEQCFAQARKKRLFDSKLRTKVRAEDYEVLEKDFEALRASAAELR